MIVSRDGKYFACADVANGVSLFKKERFLDDGTEDPEAEWQFCGKHFTHQIAITSICFVNSSFSDIIFFLTRLLIVQVRLPHLSAP